MPFIGLDWRSRGETWEKTSEGSWERTKLRPFSQPIPIPAPDPDHLPSSDETLPSPDTLSPSPPDHDWQPHCFVKQGKSKEPIPIPAPDPDHLFSSHEGLPSPDTLSPSSPDHDWQPHCFVKQGKSKEPIPIPAPDPDHLPSSDETLPSPDTLSPSPPDHDWQPHCFVKQGKSKEPIPIPAPDPDHLFSSHEGLPSPDTLSPSSPDHDWQPHCFVKQGKSKKPISIPAPDPDHLPSSDETLPSPDTLSPSPPDHDWQPHCFVKQGKSKEPIPIPVPDPDHLTSSDEALPSPDTLSPSPPDHDWQPYCFVKQGKSFTIEGKSKEFVGCTSVSEAFHKLNLARAVNDVRRLNYVCKVVEILIREKLENLSGSGRRVMISVVEAIVRQSLERYREVSKVRALVGDLAGGLETGSHVGSPKLLNSHLESASGLLRLLSTTQPAAPTDSQEEGVTLLDLPRECLRAVLRRLPDHLALMSASEALDELLVEENDLWRGLSNYHFSPPQIAALHPPPPATPQPHWRHTFFQLKKRHGLKEAYADMIHICCHCKALYWKELGHPCVAVEEPPSVRVTPHQFVDMLMFL